MNTLKKVLVAALLAAPICISAQEQKIATVNTQEIISVYPAYANAMKQLETQSKGYEDELSKMMQEGQTKLEEYNKLEQDKSTDPAILKAREDEIGALQQRIQLFRQSANEQIQKKQEDLMMTILAAVRNAISEVANEGKYTFVIDQQALSFRSSTAPDITSAVRKKLNIPANAKPVNSSTASAGAK